MCNSCAIHVQLRQEKLIFGKLRQASVNFGQRAVIRMHELNKLPQSSAIRREEVLPQRHGTRMTRIGRIFTDNFNPWVSASSAQSVFYRIPPIIDDDKKPQMKTPRVAPLEGAFTYAPAVAYVSMHCGGYDGD